MVYDATLSPLLETLDYAPGEHLSLNYQQPDGPFRSEVIEYDADVESPALAAAGGGHCWFGVNPTRPRDDGKRGGADDVTRLAAIWADLDVKPGACRDLAHAHQVIGELSAILGTRPSAVVHSGGGLQPYWPIDGGGIDCEADRQAYAALLKRWGRLACIVADGLGAKIDRGVYDLARVLRVPGTVNPKYDPPRPVTLAMDAGAPLTVDELRDRLDEHGVAELDSDRRTAAAEMVSAPDEWAHAEDGCAFWPNTLRHWRSEPVDERHRWLTKNLVRLLAGMRYGCFTVEGFAEARQVLVDRFMAECARDGRHVPPFEVPNAYAWATDRVGRMQADELPTQIGSAARPHSHVDIFEYAAAKAAAEPVVVHRSAVDRAATLVEARSTFRKWLGEDYDLDALDATLATLAVERLDGDPLWLLVVTGSGNAKTETVCSSAEVANVHITSSIASEGALLSATSKRERTEEATGGLLRQIGERGTLVVKDFTTILSMDRNARAQVLAALREIYDGTWVRQVGTDGGRAIPWGGAYRVPRGCHDRMGHAPRGRGDDGGSVRAAAHIVSRGAAACGAAGDPQHRQRAADA